MQNDDRENNHLPTSEHYEESEDSKEIAELLGVTANSRLSQSMLKSRTTRVR